MMLECCLCTNNLWIYSLPSGNKLGDAGAEALSEGLKTNSGLTELNLIGNHRWHPNKTQTTKNMLFSLFINREQDRKHRSQSTLWSIEDEHNFDCVQHQQWLQTTNEETTREAICWRQTQLFPNSFWAVSLESLQDGWMPFINNESLNLFIAIREQDRGQGR